MSKPELEFHHPAGPWTAPAGAGPGIVEQVLAEDERREHRTTLVRWEPGTDTTAQGVARHAFWEEVYIVDGALYDVSLDETFGKGTYACRPPGMAHGPWTAPDGVTMLVFTYPESGPS